MHRLLLLNEPFLFSQDFVMAQEWKINISFNSRLTPERWSRQWEGDAS